MYFSPSTCEFHFQRAGAPSDIRSISTEQHKALLAEISKGKRLAADSDGLPVIVDAHIVQSVPERCTPAQGLVALFALKNITEDNVLAAIDQIPDPVQQYTARIGYQRATVWERGSPTMRAMTQLLQLSEADLDSLFNYAVEVQV